MHCMFWTTSAYCNWKGKKAKNMMNNRFHRITAMTHVLIAFCFLLCDNGTPVHSRDAHNIYTELIQCWTNKCRRHKTWAFIYIYQAKRICCVFSLVADELWVHLHPGLLVMQMFRGDNNMFCLEVWQSESVANMWSYIMK